MHRFLSHLLLLISCLTVISAQQNCDQVGVLFYEDIGCTPVYGNQTDCPERFECDFGIKNGSCYFKNQYYEPGEVVPNELLDEICRTDCVCTEDGNFECETINCDHSFNTNSPGCYWGFEMNKCCSVGEYCPEEPRYCISGNNIIREGQVFTPPHSCYRCICQQVSNDTYDETFCKRRSCGTQIHYSRQLEQGCAPMYEIVTHPDHISLCCPSRWYCPPDEEEADGEDDENTGDDEGEDEDYDADMYCHFGSKKYKVGEFFRDNKSMFITCTCRIPPLLSCTRY